MIARLRAWFAALTARERGMVSLALGLALAIALAQGVVVPLCRAWLAARDTHALAMARSARLLHDLAEIPPPMALRPVDVVRLTRRAAQAGVHLAPPLAQGDGLALSGQGTSAAIFTWLESLRDQGVVVRRLTLTPLPGEGWPARWACFQRGLRQAQPERRVMGIGWQGANYWAGWRMLGVSA
jgi:general secretion pathway protein M